MDNEECLACGGPAVPMGALVALAREVTRRGLRPLPGYESLAEAMAVSAVSSLYMWWKRIPKNRVPYTIAVFDLYLNGGEVFKRWAEAMHIDEALSL